MLAGTATGAASPVTAPTNALSLEELVRPFGVHDRGITFVAADGAEVDVSYDALARHAASAAGDLRRRGVRAGDRVGVVLDTSLPSVAVCLGLWMLGATVLSLPPVRRGAAGLYRSGIGGVLRQVDTRLVVASSAVAAALDGVTTVVAADRVDLAAPAVPPDTAVASPALIQFTSGSTGSPRGVAIEPRSVAGHAATIAAALELEPTRDRGVSWLPLHHDMGLVGFLLTPLAVRVDVDLVAPRVFARDPASWLNRCARRGATVTGAPNFAYRLAARLAELRGVEGRLDRLRVCLSGAERVTWDVLEDFAAVAGPHGLRWEALMPVYGLAEATLAVTFPPIGRGPVRDANGAVLLGHPLPGVEVRLEPISGDPGHGRVCLRGEWLLDHYLTESGTAPATDPDGWLRTGDVADSSGGELVVLGRLDETVMAGGRNIYAEDLEVLALDAAGDAAMLAAAFRLAGDRDGFGIALELAASSPEGAERAARAIKEIVVDGLEVSPAVYVLSPLTIPRTSSGKVRRGECRRITAEAAWPEAAVLASA